MRYGIAQWPFVRRWRVYLLFLLLAAVTILVYRPAWNGGFLWDDDDYITNNDLLTASDGLRRIWFSFDSPSQYFPLTYTSFRIERALWGLNPSGYHWTNIFLHVANALLVWRLLARLKLPGAWLAAAIFALHPVQVESVAWITEQKNVLMGFFFLLTLLAWIAFTDESTRRPWRFYALAVILYALALSAKTTACTLPATLLLILWLQKKPISKRRLIQILPFLILGFSMGLVAVWWERYHQGTHGPLFALSPLERTLVASHAVWFYLGKLLWPSNLIFIYPKWTIAATLSPVLGFIMLYTFRYTFVADHYQYLACIAPIALFSAGTANLAGVFTRARPFILSAAACLTAALWALTWRQSAMYGDIEALWRTTLRKNPDCWMAHNNLGIVLFQKGEIDEAVSHYRTTLNLQPDFWDADYNLGTALLKKGEVDEAIAYCTRAVTIAPNDPDAQVALGNSLAQKERVDDAIAHYKKALAIRPDYFIAHYALGHIFLEKGEIDAAVFHSRAAVSIQPQNADAHTNLAVAFDEKGQIPEAISQYEQALEISPQSVAAENNLAWLLATNPDASIRHRDGALELATRANQLSGGGNATVLRTLAAAYANAGQFSRAVEVGQLALSLTDRESPLAKALQQEIAGYQAGLPYREDVKQ